MKGLRIGQWLGQFLGIAPQTYRDKCKRLRTDGPTPCLCCPDECVGDRADDASRYNGSCHKKMGNDFWFLPTGSCLKGKGMCDCDGGPTAGAPKSIDVSNVVDARIKGRCDNCGDTLPLNVNLMMDLCDDCTAALKESHRRYEASRRQPTTLHHVHAF